MESEMSNHSQNSAAFIVLDSQDEPQNHSNKLFDTLTALRGVATEQKERSPPFSPRKCELPNSGNGKGLKQTSGGQEGDGSPGPGESVPASDPPDQGEEGGGGGEGGSGGGSGGDGGHGGGSGDGDQGGDGGGDNDDDDEDVADDDEEHSEETPTSSGNSGNVVPNLVRPADHNVQAGEGNGDFAVPQLPEERDSAAEQRLSESEGGISDAPTAIVSDTEGHGQVISHGKPSSRSENTTSSPDVHQVSSTSSEEKEISSAISTMSSHNSSSGEASQRSNAAPRRKVLVKKTAPAAATTSTSEPEIVTTTTDPGEGASPDSAGGHGKPHDTSCGSSRDKSDLDISMSQQDLFAGDDVDETGEKDVEQEDTEHPVATPSENIGSLHLSGASMMVPETLEDESLSVIPPTLEASESVPRVVPSSPTSQDPEETVIEAKKSPENQSKSRPSSSTSSGMRPLSASLQQWQQSTSPLLDSSPTKDDDVPDEPRETEASKPSQSMNLQLSEVTQMESQDDDKDLVKDADSPPKDGNASVELIEISSEKSAMNEAKDADNSQDLSLHYSPTQGEPSEFTYGLDTMTERADEDTEEEVLLLDPVEIRISPKKKDASPRKREIDITPKSREKNTSPKNNKKDAPSTVETEAGDTAKQAPPSLTLDMIDTEETQDPNAENLGPVFRLKRPSVDSEMLDESMKEVSVFQRVRDEKDKPKSTPQKGLGSTSSSNDPFEFSQGRQSKDQLAFSEMQTKKEKNLLDKRRQEHQAEGASESSSRRKDHDVESPSKRKEVRSPSAPNDPGNQSVEQMDVDDEDLGEPKECPMSARPAAVVAESVDVYEAETEPEPDPGSEKPSVPKGDVRQEDKADSQTQEYTYTSRRQKEAKPEKATEHRKSLADKVQELTRAKQAAGLKDSSEKDTQILPEAPAKNPAVVEATSAHAGETPMEVAPAVTAKPASRTPKKSPAKSRKRQRRVPSRPVPEDTSDSSPAKNKQKVEERSMYDLTLSQSQREADDLARVKRLTEQARQRKASYERKNQGGRVSPSERTLRTRSRTSSVEAAHSGDTSPTTPVKTLLTTPPTAQSAATEGNKVQHKYKKCYKIVTIKTTYEHTQTFVEEMLDGKTTNYTVTNEKWETLDRKIDQSEDVVDPSPSRSITGSMTSGDLGDVSSLSRSSSNRTSLHSFGSDRQSIGTLGSRRSSKSSGGSFPLAQTHNIIGELVEVHEPVSIPLDRRLSDISTLAARESIESPRRSHLSVYAGDQSEQTFAQGILKRSSLAQGVDVTVDEYGFAAPGAPPLRQMSERDRARRSHSRSRGGSSHPAALLPPELENIHDMGAPGTSHSTMGESSNVILPARESILVPETSASTVPDTSLSPSAPAPKKHPAPPKRSSSKSRANSAASDADSVVAGTDVERPALSLPVTGTTPKSTKRKGKARRKAASPKKKVPEPLSREPDVGPAESADPTESDAAASAPPILERQEPMVTPVKPPSTGDAPEDDDGDLLDPSELNLTPPHTPGHQLSVGTHVMAMWKDKHYYSGQVKAAMKSGTYRIAFDDGNVKNNTSSTVIVCRLLPAGHWVMAEKDEWQEPAMIKGHYRDGDTYGYAVEFESGTNARIPKSMVSLDGEQVVAVLDLPVPMIAEPVTEPAVTAPSVPVPPVSVPSKKGRTPPKSSRSIVKVDRDADDGWMNFSQEIAPTLTSDNNAQSSLVQEEGADDSYLKPARVTPSRQPKQEVPSPYKPNIHPHLHLPGTGLEPSTPVMALWTDKHYYPGTVVKQDTSGRYEVRFEDGDVRHVIESEIIVCELLTIGQSVYAENEEGDYLPAMVLEHYRRGQEIGYLVEFDEGNREHVSRANVTLNLDQANALFGNSAGPACTPIGAKAFDISLDNLVAGKRRRGTGSTSTPVPGSESPSAQHITPAAVSRPTPAESEKKAKKPDAEVEPLKPNEEQVETVAGASTSKKSSKKGGSQARKTSTASKKKEPPSTKGKSGKRKAPEKNDHVEVEVEEEAKNKTPAKKRKTDSANPKAPNTPSPKSKRRLLSQDSPGEVGDQSPKYLSNSPAKTDDDKTKELKGPLPSPGSTIFKGMTFILTHASKSEEVMKLEGRLIRQSPLGTFSDDSSNEDEPIVPFDKVHISAQIKAGEGDILEDVTNLDKPDASCFLVSNSCQRTVKYICSLAAGIHCVSHLWIRDSCKMGHLLDHINYTLPAGFDCDFSKAVEWNAEHRPLEGLKTYISSESSAFVDNWGLVLKTAGCSILQKMPTKASTQSGKCQVDLVVGDPSARPAATMQAATQGVPIVSSEWVIQCLIHGHRLPYLSHPKFKHDFVL